VTFAQKMMSVKKKTNKTQKTRLEVGFFRRGVFGFYWAGFLLPTLVLKAILTTVPIPVSKVLSLNDSAFDCRDVEKHSGREIGMYRILTC
jgi:hypothetical protein